MKKLILICAIFLLLCPTCFAEENVNKIGLGYWVNTDISGNHNEIWNDLQQKCQHILLYDDGAMTAEKGGLYQVNDGKIIRQDTLYSTNNRIYLAASTHGYEFSEMISFFDCSLYKQAIEKYSGHSVNIKELIHDESIPRVFALTDNNVYVITGHGEIAANSVDELEILTFEEWKARYAEEIPVKLFVDGVDLGTEAYMGSTYTDAPLRLVLESMGSTVKWNHESKEITIDDGILLKLEENIMTGVYLKSGSSIQLQDWTGWCGYSIYDDRVYLGEIGMHNLLKIFGYDADVNIPKGEIHIIDN